MILHPAFHSRYLPARGRTVTARYLSKADLHLGLIGSDSEAEDFEPEVGSYDNHDSERTVEGRRAISTVTSLKNFQAPWTTTTAAYSHNLFRVIGPKARAVGFAMALKANSGLGQQVRGSTGSGEA